MSREFSLTIHFSRPLHPQELDSFWDELVNWLDHHKLRGGGGHDANNLDWVIDCRDAVQSPQEVAQLLKLFLEEKRDLLADYRMVHLPVQ